MMQIACHAWAFNHLPLEEALGTIARLGFQAVDLGVGPHINIDEAIREPLPTAQHIRLLLDDFHLQLTDLYVMLPHINAPDAERREQEMVRFERLIPFVAELGTPGITILPGVVTEDGPDHAIARAIPALQRMVDAVEDTDFRLSVETHIKSAASSPQRAIVLLEAVPGLSLTLDLAHFIAQSVPWPMIRNLFEYTAHIQVRQAAARAIQCRFEDGVLDFEQLIKDLAEADYHGALSIEYLISKEQTLAITHEIVKTRDALRQARYQALHI
ncbi:MAG: sugar phosphate isomerase/epimerase [Anaerolineales bacterium]|nr:sugar phosphate isomerase/epimerase [Anaerolineales bacterium]